MAKPKHIERDEPREGGASASVQHSRTDDLALVFRPSTGPLQPSETFKSGGLLPAGPGDFAEKRKPTFLYGSGGKRIPVFPGEDDAEIARLKAQGWEFTPKD